MGPSRPQAGPLQDIRLHIIESAGLPARSRAKERRRFQRSFVVLWLQSTFMRQPPVARYCLVALTLFGVTAVAAAQSTGGIVGRIAESGGPLPGVTVTATAGDQSTASIAAADGTFAIKDLRPGVYTLTATLPGFRTERRRIELTAGETRHIDLDMRVGCLDRPMVVASHPPLIDPVLPARSDLVAYVRVDERVDEDSPSDPDCRIRYKATVLRAVKRRSYPGPADGTIDVLLNEFPIIEAGKEYVIWLTWRSDKNAFDSGSEVEGLVRPVERGQVKSRTGPCIDVWGSPPNRCPDTYSVDALLTIFESALP